MRLDKRKIWEILVIWNIWEKANTKKGLLRHITQEIKKHLKEKEVLVLQGIRRSGKSTIMFQLMDFIPNKNQILYVNFEEPLFSKGDTNLLELIYQTYRENLNPTQPAFLFFDEIQNISGWEKWVRAQNEKSQDKIIITGSSAKLLNSEIATVLTGRHYSFPVFPLSFAEFLNFNGLELKTEIDIVRQKANIKNLLNKFIKYGGFPAVVLQKNHDKKIALLKQYFDDILYKDVVSRHQIRDLKTLKELSSFLLANISNLISYNKIKNLLGIPLDVVRNYISYLEEAYLIAENSFFSFKIREQIIRPKKIYCCDTGLRNAAAFSFSKDSGRLIENLVYHSLIRQEKEVYYYQNKREVDFLGREKGGKLQQAIQVCFSNLEDKKTAEREVNGLKEVMDKLSVPSGIIITDDKETILRENKHSIYLIPLWKWLLDF